jgi:hypothetical protein
LPHNQKRRRGQAKTGQAWKAEYEFEFDEEEDIDSRP